MNQANTLVGSFVRVTYPNGKWKGSYEGYVYEVRPRGCEILWKDGSDRGSLTYVKYKYMEVIGDELVTETHMQSMIEEKLQVQLPGGVIKGSIPIGCGKLINVEEGEDAFPLQPTPSGIVDVNDQDKEGEDAEDPQASLSGNEGEDAFPVQPTSSGIVDVNDQDKEGEDAEDPQASLSGNEGEDAFPVQPTSSGIVDVNDQDKEGEDAEDPQASLSGSSRKRKLESLEQRVKNMETFLKNFGQTVNAQQQNIFDILASRRTPATPKKGRNEAEV